MTPEHIDAVLPRVPAGIPALGGDLTDPDERVVAIDWLMGFYGAAEAQQGTRTPSDTPAALRNEHRAESGQHTLTTQTTIELDDVALAVCVVDGEPAFTDAHAEWLGVDNSVPPAWLVEARDGTCETCGDDFGWAPGWRSTEPFAVEPERCPDCFDGRPAVEVWQDKEVEDFDIWQVDNLTGRAVVFLGCGTVEHVLPVVPKWHDMLGPNPPVIDLEGGVAILRVPDHWGDDIILDIDLGPDPTRKKVVLVRMEDA